MRVSFDFDNTLYHPFGYNGSNSNDQMNDIQSLAKEYLRSGYDVFIVTKRYGPENRSLGLTNEHLLVYEIAFRLGIVLENVHFTNREMKFKTLLKLGINRHFEDDEYECDLIRNSNKMLLEGSKIEVIPVLDPYWKDLVN